MTDRDQGHVLAELAVVAEHLAVDRSVHGDHGRQPEVGVDRRVERAGQGVLVHHVEPDLRGQLLHRPAHGDRVHHLRVGLPKALRHGTVPDRYEHGGGAGLAGADDVDLVALVDEAVGEIRHDRLHTAVRGRWNVEVGRYDEGHPQRSPAHALRLGPPPMLSVRSVIVPTDRFPRFPGRTSQDFPLFSM